MQRIGQVGVIRRSRVVGTFIVLVCLLMVTGTAWAAELAPDAGEVYRDSMVSLDVHCRKLVKRGSVSTSTLLPGSLMMR